MPIKLGNQRFRIASVGIGWKGNVRFDALTRL
jgi:hypothetical protein